MPEEHDPGEDQTFERRFTRTVIRLALLALLVFLCLRVLQPFINPIIGGVVVAIALHVPYGSSDRG